MHDAPVDLILTHGLFTTLDPSVQDPEAVAIAAGRFAAVGDFDDLIGEAGPTTRIIDLGGRRVIPSPNPSQVHLSMTGAWVGRGREPGPFAARLPWAALTWLASGHHKLGRGQALQLCVDSGAATSTSGSPGGVIKTGRSANLIVLSADVMIAPEAEILEIMPLLVFFEGQVVYGAGPFQVLMRGQDLRAVVGLPARGDSPDPPIVGTRR